MDPRRERELNCARSQSALLSPRRRALPFSCGGRTAGNEKWMRGWGDGGGERKTVVTDGGPRDLFDAVLNGRLEIKKLRINTNLGTGRFDLYPPPPPASPFLPPCRANAIVLLIPRNEFSAETAVH